MRKLAGFLLALALLVSLVPGQDTRDAVPARADLETKLRFAATQHEIISILLQEQQFELVMEEFNKILALQFSGEHEKLVVQEAWIVAQQLLEKDQFAVAHEIIDATIEQVQSSENRFTLLMLKGKILKDEGKLQEALSVYQEARQLQNR
ncbi:MAG TPA: hypothetical protein VKZ59_15640 [Acidobacteriota bacterium]|nr:hypothetical protein [Acidobacteriota bacterium]